MANTDTLEAYAADQKWNAGMPPSTAVVTAVADARGVDVTDLRPLYDAVDAEALNTLLGASAEEALLEVSFEYEGFTVTLRPDGRIELVERDD